MNKQQSGEMLRRMAGMEITIVRDDLVGYQGKWTPIYFLKDGDTGLNKDHTFNSEAEAQNDIEDTLRRNEIVWSGRIISPSEISYAFPIPVRS
jgi:hypothetical protein